MAGQRKGFMKKRADLPIAPTPPAAADTPDASAVDLTEDGGTFFATGTGFDSNTGASAHFEAWPAEGNSSNETFGVERLGLATDDAGNVVYTCKKSSLQDSPDDLPRLVTVRVYTANESATDSLDWS